MATYAAKGDRFEENTIKNFAVDENLVQYVSKDITSAEIKAFYSAPYEIIPAPGTNKFIEFISAILFHDCSSAFTVQSNLEFRYGGDASTNNGVEVPGGFISNTYILRDSADMLMQFHSEYDAFGTPETSLFNKNINFFADQANPGGTGGGTLKIRVAYRIHDFN